MNCDDDLESIPLQPSDEDDLTVSVVHPAGLHEEDILTADGADRGSMPTPQQPATIAGYRIIGLLGQGGMGVVWEAEQERPRRRVALKVMRREHQVDDLHARLFHREAETLARLEHPNIAAIHGTGHTEDGRDYFAMELVRGQTLDRWQHDRPSNHRRRRARPPPARLPGDLQRCQLRPPARRHPPRPQTVQHHRGHGGGRGGGERRRIVHQDSRLRARPHHRPQCGRDLDVRGGHYQGNPALHEPGAGPGRNRDDRRPHRRLRSRRDPLRDARRPTPVRH